MNLKFKAKGLPLSSLVFNIILKVLARALGKENKKRHPNRNKEVKLSLFSDNMILHIDLKTTCRPPKNF